MPTTKKTTKKSTFPLIGSKKLNSRQLIILVAAFVILGVGAFYWFKSHAAGLPPTGFLNVHTVYPNGTLQPPTQCLSTAFSTGYGPIAANCMEMVGGGKAIFGFYSPINKAFAASTGTESISGAGVLTTALCKNFSGAPFVGFDAITPAGRMAWGYVYVWYVNWAAEAVSYNPATGNCYSSTSYTPTGNFKKIQTW